MLETNLFSYFDGDFMSLFDRLSIKNASPVNFSLFPEYLLNAGSPPRNWAKFLGAPRKSGY
jgi:hypothetical protein